nr:hypothetical protein GCM10020093_061310 [Planobispora longispora]
MPVPRSLLAIRLAKSAAGFSSLWMSMACLRVAVAKPSRQVTTPFWFVIRELLAIHVAGTGSGVHAWYGAARRMLATSIE